MAEENMVEGNNDWDRLRLDGIRDRLAEIRNLLRQAAAVGLAQDVARLETLAELHKTEDNHAHTNRRRYR
jgi:hypothetical protein